uniref:Uncharacterized protein n=1 Tax=Caenorhabditis japonica TaxID=281687 RepID=A0A8R1EX02_CAEJA
MRSEIFRGKIGDSQSLWAAAETTVIIFGKFNNKTSMHYLFTNKIDLRRFDVPQIFTLLQYSLRDHSEKLRKIGAS